MEGQNELVKKSTARILILDDSRAFLSGIKSILASCPYEITSHTSPQNALNEIQLNKFDIIISDLEMPEISGFEFIKRVRENLSLVSVPILALTGTTDTDAMSRAIESGADAFCSKENIRYTIFPQILALLRLRSTYEASTRGMQLEAVKALIGTYKHEFGNSLAIIDGKLRKLNKTFPDILEDPAMESIQSAVKKFNETLLKLNELRHYDEEKYSSGSNILKVG